MVQKNKKNKKEKTRQQFFPILFILIEIKNK